MKKWKKMMNSKRAFSAVISSLILMLLAVAAGVVVYAYAMGWLGGATTNPRQFGLLSFDTAHASVISSKIMVAIRNVGGTTVTLDQVYVNGNNATASCTPTISSLSSLSPQGVVSLNVIYTMTTGLYYNIQVTCKDGTMVSQSVQALGTTQTITRWFNNSWNYRKSHTINGIGTNAETNYQIRIVVVNGTGADNGEIVYVNNKARSDFGDIRFTTLNGTLLDYWMENLNTGMNATFWVKIAGNLTDQTQMMYLYYGNPAASTTSNGDNTFIFFDDFSGNLSKWNVHVGNQVAIVSGYGDPSPCLEISGGSTNWPFGFTAVGSDATYAGFQDGVIEADVYPATDALPEIIFRGNYSENTGYKGRWDCRSDEETPWFTPPYDGWGGFGDDVPRFGIPNQWQQVRLVVYNFTFTIYSNNNLKSTVTDSDSQYSGPGEIGLANHYGTFARFDNVRVRKYVEPEPSNGIWGSEEF